MQTDNVTIGSTQSVTDDEWHHVVIVFDYAKRLTDDGTKIIFFLNLKFTHFLKTSKLVRLYLYVDNVMSWSVGSVSSGEGEPIQIGIQMVFFNH